MELSIDTSTRYASLGLSEQGISTLELTWHSGRNHSVELVPAIRQLLKRAAISIDGIKAVIVARGPGGFSALRVGISTAKALAAARHIPLVAVGTLDVEAAPYTGLGLPVCALIDAGHGWLYAGYFYECAQKSGDGQYQVINTTELAATIQSPTVFCGEGVDAVADLLRYNLGANALVVDTPMPTRRAAVLARLGYMRLAAGKTDDPESLQPLYIRGSQYERAERGRATT